MHTAACMRACTSTTHTHTHTRTHTHTHTHTHTQHTYLCELWAVLPPLSFNVGWQHSLIQRVSKVLPFVNTKHTGFWTFDHGWRESEGGKNRSASWHSLHRLWVQAQFMPGLFCFSNTPTNYSPSSSEKAKTELQIPAVQEWMDSTSQIVQYTLTHTLIQLCVSVFISEGLQGQFTQKLSSANTKYILRKHTDTMKGNAVQCGFVHTNFHFMNKK